jgi:hypothetical protein
VPMPVAAASGSIIRACSQEAGSLSVRMSTDTIVATPRDRWRRAPADLPTRRPGRPAHTGDRSSPSEVIVHTCTLARSAVGVTYLRALTQHRQRSCGEKTESPCTTRPSSRG